tara:strand:+ start:206 stop:478 length:273 start_codon:yes stop_codon:yes gene_type:complete
MGRSVNHFTYYVGGNHLRGNRTADPETKLFTAVLSQAVHDVFSTHVEKIDKAQAMDFLTEDSSHLRMICELAGRNPNYVRQKIRKKLLET